MHAFMWRWIVHACIHVAGIRWLDLPLGARHTHGSAIFSSNHPMRIPCGSHADPMRIPCDSLSLRMRSADEQLLQLGS